MRKQVLLPSGMRASTFYYPWAHKARLAFPHIRTPALAVRPSYPYHRADAPASFLHTTMPDMLSWCRACLDRGRTCGQRILSGAGYSRMWTPAAAWGFPPLYESMGLGWTLGHYRGFETVSHGGMGLGWADFLTFCLSRGTRRFYCATRKPRLAAVSSGHCWMWSWGWRLFPGLSPGLYR